MLAEIVFLLTLIISIILHEIAHGWVAYSLGDPTAKLEGRLTINPIKHIDMVGSIIVPVFLVLINSTLLFGWAKPVPYNPYNLPSRKSEALVAAAGSILNFSFAIIFGLLVRFFEFSSFIEYVFTLIVVVNLFLAVLNMLPIPPLDGYKVLSALLPSRLSDKFQEFERSIISKFGLLGSFVILFAIIFILISVISQIVFGIADFIIGADAIKLLFA